MIAMTQEKKDVYLSITDTAARLKVHHVTVRKLIKSGELPAKKVGREWRVIEADLEEFMRKR